MRKTAIILIALSFVATFVICGKAFAQKDANDAQESVKALMAVEKNILDSSPAPAPETGMEEEIEDEEAVDEDA